MQSTDEKLDPSFTGPSAMLDNEDEKIRTLAAEDTEASGAQADSRTLDAREWRGPVDEETSAVEGRGERIWGAASGADRAAEQGEQAQ
jgi:hypothetical protein